MNLTLEQLKTLLRRHISIAGDGNVVGHGNDVLVIKDLAGNYTIQIRELNINLSLTDLRNTLTSSTDADEVLIRYLEKNFPTQSGHRTTPNEGQQNATIQDNVPSSLIDESQQWLYKKLRSFQRLGYHQAFRLHLSTVVTHFSIF